MPTRRQLITTAATGASAAVVAVLLRESDGGGARVPLGAQPSGLPTAQHGWDATLRRDRHGNPLAPRFDRLLMFDLAGAPDPGRGSRLEAALRTLERWFSWGPDGLLFTLGWGPRYFASIGVESPVPEPHAMSVTEAPELDRYAACLHLAADDQQRLAAVEAALVHGGSLSGTSVDIRQALVWRETRMGFNGSGLPEAHRRAGGIPRSGVKPKDAPLFMGFRSGLRRNQASEQSVTLEHGPVAGGTTQHVSAMRLALESWYGLLGPAGRVARMYGPQVTPRQAARFTDDARSDPAGFAEAARDQGVVGHSQCAARARRNGRPVILRRDFDTVDGGQAGVHFVSLQRSIDDFVRTRQAMNAVTAPYINPAITDTVNNGINEFLIVDRRANYVVPPRSMRAFPLSGVVL